MSYSVNELMTRLFILIEHYLSFATLVNSLAFSNLVILVILVREAIKSVFLLDIVRHLFLLFRTNCPMMTFLQRVN